MRDFKHWIEKSKHLYRYVIAPNVCYEIHIMTWNHNTDIMSANAHLYITGDWRDKNGSSFFERELLHTGPLASCLEAAYEDDLKNNTTD